MCSFIKHHCSCHKLPFPTQIHGNWGTVINMGELPRAVITNYHNLGCLKQKFIVCKCMVLEARCLKSKYQQGHVTSEIWRKESFLASSSFGQPQSFISCCRLACRFISSSLCLNHHVLPMTLPPRVSLCHMVIFLFYISHISVRAHATRVWPHLN